MLKILHDGTPKMREALLTLMAEQPIVAVRALNELAKTIALTVQASERLIQAQRILDGSPTSTVRVEHATAPPPRLSDDQLEAEVRRVREAVERLARDDEAIDATATTAPTITTAPAPTTTTTIESTTTDTTTTTEGSDAP